MSISGRSRANEAQMPITVNGSLYLPDCKTGGLRTVQSFGKNYVYVHDGHVWTSAQPNGPYVRGPKLGTADANKWLED